jgi:hypothetical protein
VKVTRLRRLPRPSFALSSSTEVSVEFDEIDPDTGLAFEEVFSFSKARALTRARAVPSQTTPTAPWLSAASAL